MLIAAWKGGSLLPASSAPSLARHVRRWRKGEVGAFDAGHDLVVFLEEAVRQELGRTGHYLEWSTDGQFRATFQYKGEAWLYIPPQRDYTWMLLSALKSAACLFRGQSLRRGLASRCHTDIAGIEAALEKRLGGRWDF